MRVVCGLIPISRVCCSEKRLFITFAKPSSLWFMKLRLIRSNTIPCLASARLNHVHIHSSWLVHSLYHHYYTIMCKTFRQKCRSTRLSSSSKCPIREAQSSTLNISRSYLLISFVNSFLSHSTTLKRWSYFVGWERTLCCMNSAKSFVELMFLFFVPNGMRFSYNLYTLVDG